MAKIPYSKFKIKLNNSVKNIEFKDYQIEVKQYLPVDDKLTVISKILNNSYDQDFNYSNPVKIQVFTVLEIIFAYTNITFTQKQKENIPELYDELSNSGIIEEIYKAIPEKELDFLQKGIEESIKSIYQYRNSALGILEYMKNRYDSVDFDLTEITKNIENPEVLTFVKDVLNKL